MIPDVFALLNTSPMQASLGSPLRLYRHGRAPQSIAAIYATWGTPSIAPENSLEDAPRADRVEVHLDLWSSNAGDDWRALEAAGVIARDTIEAAGHCVTAMIDGGQDAATNRYRLTIQFTIWASR